MRSRVLIILGVLILVALAFGAGLLTQRYFQLVVISETVDTIVGPAEQPPELVAFAFPNSEFQFKGSAGGATSNRGVVIHAPQIGMWTTSESFEDVIVHYARTMGFQRETNIENRQSLINAASYLDLGKADASSKALIRDNSKPESAYPPSLRSVRIECLVKRTRTYHVNVMLSRADDDELTHIVVVYDELF